jgi:hypothetical protein
MASAGGEGLRSDGAIGAAEDHVHLEASFVVPVVSTTVLAAGRDGTK